MIDRVKALCALPGVSGHEEAVREAILALIRPHADEIRIDAMGTVMALRKGRQPGPVCMMAAHMDEVGLMVTRVAEDGALHFDCVGSIDERLLLSKRVYVGAGAIPGVIAAPPVHLGSKEKIKADALRIDIGADSRIQAQEAAAPGDPVVFEGPPVEMGEGWLRAKAIDDRAGCAVLTMLAQETPAVDTWLVFTAQEEVGARGAACAAHALRPDYAFVIESTTAADIAGNPAHKAVCRPGHGVVLPFMDKGTIYSPALLKHLHTLADGNGIARQTKEVIAGGTDAAAIHRSRDGIPTAGLAAAVRSIHSPVSAAKIGDLEDVYKLALLAYTEPFAG